MRKLTAEVVQELEQNEDFRQSLANVATPEEVQALMAQYDIEVSIDEINDMIEMPDGELLESDLEDVSGGCSLWRPGAGLRIIWRIPAPPIRPPHPILIPIWLRPKK